MKIKRMGVLFFLGVHPLQIGSEEDNEDGLEGKKESVKGKGKNSGTQTIGNHKITQKDVYNLKKKSVKQTSKRRKRLEATLKLVHILFIYLFIFYYYYYYYYDNYCFIYDLA
jgi:hypothetical protein